MKHLHKSFAHYLVLIACLYSVYMMGVLNLKSDPISDYSEWNSLRHVGLFAYRPLNSFPELIASIQRHSPDHAPLYFILIRLWAELVGTDLLTYRLLSLYFGVLTIAFAYRLALITGARRTACFAALLTTFLAYLFYFSHEARMYSLLPLLSAFVAWMYWQMVSDAGRVGWWKWLSLTMGSAAIIYTHYFGIMILAAIGMYHLLFVQKDRRWFGICLAMTVAGLLFMPWAPVVLDGLAFRDEVVSGSDRLSLIESTFAIAGIYSNGLIIAVPAVVVAIMLKLRRLNNPER